MKLDRLELTWFGKFADRAVELGPGLNLIYGPNESGKSTLQNFVRGMLFGFKKSGNRRSYDEALERFQPWRGDKYLGVLEYTLGDRPYRIERNFAPEGERVRVLDGSTWQDITANFPMDRRKEVLFAEEHLGMNQVVFDNTVCVRQLQSRSSADLAGEIRAKLVNLVSTGEEDISLQQALRVLEEELRQLGQSERAGKTPLGQAAAKVEELERTRQATLEVYGEIRAAEENCQVLQEDLQELEQARQRLQREDAAAEAAEIKGTLARVEAYDRKISELALALKDGYQDFPLADKENLALALERQGLAAGREQELAEKAEVLAKRLEQQRQILANFEAFAAFDQESVVAVENSFTRLDEAAQQAELLEQKRGELVKRRRVNDEQFSALAGCARLGQAGEAEVDSLEEEISSLTLERWPYDSERLKLNEANLAQRLRLRTVYAVLSLALGALLGVVLGKNVNWRLGFLPLAGVLLALGFWPGIRQDKHKLKDVRKRLEDSGRGAAASEQELKEKQERLQALLAEAGVGSTRELGEKMRQLALVQHSRQTVLLELVEVENSLDKLRQKVHHEARELAGRFLVPAGIAIPGQSISRDDIEQFRGGVSTYLELKAREMDLLRQEEGLTGEREKARVEVKTLVAAVQRILNAAGVSSPAEFLSAYEANLQLAEVEKSMAGLKLARAEVLGPLKVETLEEKLRRLQAGLGRGLEASDRSREEIRDELRSTEEKIQETKELIANLQGIIETRLQGVSNLAEIEAELMEAWRRKKQVIRRKKALELARQTILQVSQEVQQEFAPLVNRHMANTVSRVTGGRYVSGKVDHELNLKVVVPETGEVKDVGLLSLGTVDQFYFALRLALMELIGAKFPLILDEPFAQYDDGRLESALRVVLELASQHQVLLFSCHRRELEILSRIAPEQCTVINL